MIILKKNDFIDVKRVNLISYNKTLFKLSFPSVNEFPKVRQEISCQFQQWKAKIFNPNNGKNTQIKFDKYLVGHKVGNPVVIMSLKFCSNSY